MNHTVPYIVMKSERRQMQVRRDKSHNARLVNNLSSIKNHF